jgi:hypothetical protein
MAPDRDSLPNDLEAMKDLYLQRTCTGKDRLTRLWGEVPAFNSKWRREFR